MPRATIGVPPSVSKGFYSLSIILIGYRGTGKTTVAQILARRLGRPWFDADPLIERRAGKSIREIFAQDGEQAFRDLESAVVADLVKLSEAILALGGGAVLREENRRAIAASGAAVVWLQAQASTILARISRDPTTGERRPDLTVAGGYAEIQELVERRAPIYQQCSDFVVDTQGKTPEQVADVIFGLTKTAC